MLNYELSNEEFYRAVLQIADQKERLAEIYNYTAYQLRLSNLANLSVFLGGRGTGKTFTILKQLVENNIKFIWLRDTEIVVDKVSKGQSLTAPVELEYPEFPHIEFIKDDGNITFAEKKEDDIKIYGYLMALSTFKNARGIDYSDIEYIIWDEFIPEKGSKKVAFQDSTFLNMYETVCRNRELKGKPPVKIIFLSNANSIYNDVLEVFYTMDGKRLSELLEEMIDSNVKIYKTDDIMVRFLENKAFMEQKKKTFIYRVTAPDSEFHSMALSNRFTYSKKLLLKNPSMKKSKGLFKLSNRYTCVELEDGTIFFKRGNYKDIMNYDLEDDHELLLFKYLFNDSIKKKYIIGRVKFDSIFTQKFILDVTKINK